MLKDTEMVDRKRSEVAEEPASNNGNKDPRKRRSSVDLTKNNAKRLKTTNEPFKCLLCDKMLTYKNHSEAVDHFAIHAWIFMQSQNNMQDNQHWFNCVWSHLPVESYLHHFGLTTGPEVNKMLEDLKQKIQDVINGKWCSICLGKVDTRNCCNKNPKFLVQKLKRVQDIESLRSIISPKKSFAAANPEDEDKEFCEFCVDGFKPSQYYEHMALGHLKELFEKELLRRNTEGKYCKICHYMSKDKDDLILHLGQYHQYVEWGIRQLQNQDGHDQNNRMIDIYNEMIYTEQVTKDFKLFHCKKCKITFQEIHDLRLHVKDHIKQSWPLSKAPPYICQECFYEASTYLSLFKHVGTKHGPELKGYYNKIMLKQLLPFQNGPPEARIQEKKTFTISAPSPDIIPKKPKVKFIDMINKVYSKHVEPTELGMISHKKSLITIFGHKHFRPKFQQKFYIFE